MARIVITGANRGIGLALVRECLKRGHEVIAACRHSSPELDQLGAAGWNFSALNLPALHQVVRQFHRRLELCGFELIHAADRRALDRA